MPSKANEEPRQPPVEDIPVASLEADDAARLQVFRNHVGNSVQTAANEIGQAALVDASSCGCARGNSATETTEGTENRKRVWSVNRRGIQVRYTSRHISRPAVLSVYLGPSVSTDLSE